MMEPGIFAKTFGQSSAWESLKAVRAAGLKVAHYNMVCSGLEPMPEGIPDEEDRAIRFATEQHGVQVVAMSGTYNMIHPDSAVREKGLRRLKTLASFCNDIDIRIITLCTGTRDPVDKWAHHDENNDPSAWNDLCKEMDKALQIAADYDMLLAFEPELANVINTCAKGRRLINEMATPRLRVVFDPANLFEVASKQEQRRLIEEGIDLLSEHIIMAHAKDRKSDGSFCAAGKGCLDYPFFLDLLQQSKLDVPLILHGLTDDEVPWSVDYITSLMG